MRVTIGGRGLKEGIVELKWRIEDDIRKVAIDEVVEVVTSAIREKNYS